MYTHFTSSTTAALTAPVTEVAFYTVPNSKSEEAKVVIEEDEIESTHPVITVGKSWGGAVGWGELMALVCYVFDIVNVLYIFESKELWRSIRNEERQRRSSLGALDGSSWRLWLCKRRRSREMERNEGTRTTSRGSGRIALW